MAKSPDDERRALDLFFENLGDPETEQFDIDQLLQRQRAHTRFKIDYAQAGPEALPDIPAAFLDRFGTVTGTNEIDTPNSALLCGVIHGQKGGLNRSIAADRELFCQFVIMQTRMCDLWIALRDDYRAPPVRFLMEGLREHFFVDQERLSGTPELKESVEIIDRQRYEISENGMDAANHMFDALGTGRSDALNSFESWSLFYANCFLAGKVDVFKPGAPDVPLEQKSFYRIRREMEELSLLATDPTDDEAMQLLQQWQEYYRRDYNVRHQYAFGNTAPRGLTVVGLGRSHLGSIEDNSSVTGGYAESAFQGMRNCAFDFSGAVELEELFNRKISREFNPFTATPDDLRQMLNKIRTG